jgi:hypothetical protein
VPAEETYADPVADLPRGHGVTDGVDRSDDLVAGNDGLAGIGAQALGAQHVAMADAAGLYPDANVIGIRRNHLTVHQLELVLFRRLPGAVGSHQSSSNY